jgi:hypothetical protein
MIQKCKLRLHPAKILKKKIPQHFFSTISWRTMPIVVGGGRRGMMPGIQMVMQNAESKINKIVKDGMNSIDHTALAHDVFGW